MTVTPADDLAGARHRFLDALGAVDRDGALAVVDGLLAAGVAPRDVLSGLIGEAQREVGERWQCGDWNVAQEHAATAISESAIALVAARRSVRSADRPRAGKVAVACVDGEWHALPARLVAETLADLDWDVTYLGASVPASHLVQFLHDTGPDVVALSCSLPSNLPAARRVIAAARSAGVPVVVGGRGFGADDSRARALGANGWAPDPVTAARLVADWEPDLGPVPASTHPAAVEADRLVSRLPLLVDAVGDALADVPGLADATERGALDPEVDLDHLLRALAAGMLLPDPSIVDESVAWWATVLTARGVAPADAGRVAGLTADVLDRHDLPVAAAALRAAATP
jgi:methanogenic corrinoid protein MtbC1